jgi:hypothetical protein
MRAQEEDLTDEAYQNLYKDIYPEPWTLELLDECKIYLNNWNDAYRDRIPKFVREADEDQRIHFKNVINYWEKKLK